MIWREFFLKVKDVMKKKIYTINANEPITQALKKMEKYGVSRLLVEKDKKIVGIITERDIAKRLGHKRERKLSPSHIFVSSAYTKNLITANPNDDLKSVARKMLSKRISSVVVEENGEIVGIVTKTDLVRTLVDSKKKVREYMKKPVTVQSTDSILMVRKLMLNKGIKRLPVMKGKELVGMITEGDVAKLLFGLRKMVEGAELKRRFKDLKVGDIMRKKKLITISPEDTLGTAARKMLKNDISSLPVVDEKGELVGIITKTDLVRSCLE
ncbi:MAG: CBS domain-containing protein [Candidatus Aenigmarchaeota archaeon]|nr:CBS domain-containing protein [Candidatus Aenigmarchaeota archaeon]